MRAGPLDMLEGTRRKGNDTMATLEIRSLTKWYGPVRGADDVTFAIEPGEIFGYLGPNG